MMKKKFNSNQYVWQAHLNYRLHPTKYHVGKGEQGVLICEPYKSEILPYWQFKTPALAKKSANKIYRLFISYLEHKDFIGADMARKYLQMGFTRARRYANYAGGKKYHQGKLLARGTGQEEKAISAAIFYKKWRAAETHRTYKRLKLFWKEHFG